VAFYTQGQNLNSAPVFKGFYPEPAANGQLTITAYSGSVLTIKDADGDASTFNVLTQTFQAG
jgi:hypothetical protein